MASAEPVTIEYPVDKTISANTLSNATKLPNSSNGLAIADLAVTNLGDATTHSTDGIIYFDVDEGYLAINVSSAYMGEYDTSDVNKILTYKGIPIYVRAVEADVEAEIEAETTYDFFIKAGEWYYTVYFNRFGYYPHTQDTTLPQVVSKYIDALSVYIDSTKAELAEYPEVIGE